jgi:hypothetical protein
MIGILLGILIIALVMWITYMIVDYDAVPAVIIAGVTSLLCMLIIVPAFLIPATGGMICREGGEAEGYVVQVYREGVFWVTCNIDMLAGDKGTTVLMCGSITDKDIEKKATSLIGKKVRVHFKKWVITPFWVGREVEVFEIEEIK